MSKFRRSSSRSGSVCSSPRRDNNNNNTNNNQATKYNLNKSKLISHDEFFNRIQRSLYYGGGKQEMSIPLSDYIADTFSDTHKSYSLNRLSYATVGNLRTTPCSLILAMIYLDRLKDADPAYTKHITPTELFLVSMMVATKFYSGHDDDSPSVNWAEYANMTPDNLLQMELAFLGAIDWKVYVSNDEFFDKLQSLETTLARKQGMYRGWFTYMEMNSLLPAIKLAKQFLHITLIMGLSYTAFVTTMIASVFLVSQIPGSYLKASMRSTSISTSNDGTVVNSSLSQQTTDGNVNSSRLSTTTSDGNLLDASDFDENMLLELSLDTVIGVEEQENSTDLRKHRINSESIPTTWWSNLITETFDWSVIVNRLAEIGTPRSYCMTCNDANDGLTTNIKRDTSMFDLKKATYQNSTIYSLLANFQPSALTKLDFNSIKMKWA